MAPAARNPSSTSGATPRRSPSTAVLRKAPAAPSTARSIASRIARRARYAARRGPNPEGSARRANGSRGRHAGERVDPDRAQRQRRIGQAGVARPPERPQLRPAGDRLAGPEVGPAVRDRQRQRPARWRAVERGAASTTRRVPFVVSSGPWTTTASIACGSSASTAAASAGSSGGTRAARAPSTPPRARNRSGPASVRPRRTPSDATTRTATIAVTPPAGRTARRQRVSDGEGDGPGDRRTRRTRRTRGLRNRERPVAPWESPGASARFCVVPIPCLVTGGAGFIGSSLARALVARGDRVRVIDNLSSGRRENLADISKDVELIEADIRDEAALGRRARRHRARLSRSRRPVGAALAGRSAREPRGERHRDAQAARTPPRGRGSGAWSTPPPRRPTATRRPCPRSRRCGRCRSRPTPSRSWRASTTARSSPAPTASRRSACATSTSSALTRIRSRSTPPSSRAS